MIADIVIIAILCAFSVIGYKKGMLASLLSIFNFILSIYITYLIMPYVSNLIKSIIPLQNISASWINTENLSTFMQNHSKLSILVRFLLHSGDNFIVDNILSVIINGVLFVLTSIIIRILLKSFALRLSNLLKSFFVFGTFDRMCGLLFGFAKGLLIACLLCFVVVSIAELNLFSQNIIYQISTSSLINVFANNTNQIIVTISNSLAMQ